MEKEKIERIAKKVVEAKRLLEEIGKTSFEGVNANVRRALISMQEVLYNLGEESRWEELDI
jgi:hypothetical protein